MAFLGLQFEVHSLSGLADFYVNRLGLKLLDNSPERLDIQAGQTKLCFSGRGHTIRLSIHTQYGAEYPCPDAA